MLLRRKRQKAVGESLWVSLFISRDATERVPPSWVWRILSDVFAESDGNCPLDHEYLQASLAAILMKLRLAVILSLCLISLFVAPVVHAQEGSIKQAMSPEEFHRAGLDKLSDEELKNLDRWLQGDREKTAKQAAARTAKSKMDVIVSRVNGSFGGLGGGTVIQLEDGTAWKQANADDHYRGTSVDHPGAAVIHGIFGYKMRIEGVPEFYVDPVRK